MIALSILLGLASVGSFLLGLLFLVGSAGQPHRLAVGAVGLALAGVFAGIALKLWKSSQMSSPERIRQDLLALASGKGGQLSEADVVAAFGTRAGAAMRALHDALASGHAQRMPVAGVTRYVFPELQPALWVRRCQHCAWEAPLSSSVSSCERCGAPVALQRVAGDDSVGLDHE